MPVTAIVSISLDAEITDMFSGELEVRVADPCPDRLTLKLLAVNELLTVADPYTGSLNVNSRVSDPTKVIVSRTGANLSFSTTEFEVVSESITS